MDRYFGIPILLAIILGLMFPYTAIEISPYGIVFLFILMFNAGLGMDWQKFRRSTGRTGHMAIQYQCFRATHQAISLLC